MSDPKITESNIRSGWFLGLIILFAMTSCQETPREPRPENLVPEPTYIDLLVELQHVRTLRNSQPDSIDTDSLQTLTNIVYEKYDVNEEQFRSSHRYYQTQIDEQLRRVEEAVRRMDNEEQLIQAHIDSVKAANAPEDSVGEDQEVGEELELEPEAEEQESESDSVDSQ